MCGIVAVAVAVAVNVNVNVNVNDHVNVNGALCPGRTRWALMRTLVDDRLRREAEVFRLRHTCDDCIHFDGAACSHGYPTEPHRVPLATAREVLFCKELELG